MEFVGSDQDGSEILDAWSEFWFNAGFRWISRVTWKLLMAGSIYLWFMLLTISLSSAIERPGHKEVKAVNKVFLSVVICMIALVCQRNSFWLMAHRDRLLLAIGSCWILAKLFFFLYQKRKKKQMAAVCLMLVTTLTLTGCSTEIEDKTFVNTVIVTKDQIFLIAPELFKSTGEEKSQSEDSGAIEIPVSDWQGIDKVTGRFTNKEIEISHLEVLIVEQELFSDEEFCRELYQNIMEDTRISWNTCLLTTTMAKPQKLNALEIVEGNLGNYLMQVMEESEIQSETVTDFMKKQEEKEASFLIPRVYVKEKIPRILIE